jgi:hypothetical protein
MKLFTHMKQEEMCLGVKTEHGLIDMKQALHWTTNQKRKCEGCVEFYFWLLLCE